MLVSTAASLISAKEGRNASATLRMMVMMSRQKWLEDKSFHLETFMRETKFKVFN